LDYIICAIGIISNPTDFELFRNTKQFRSENLTVPAGNTLNLAIEAAVRQEVAIAEAVVALVQVLDIRKDTKI